MILNIAEFTFLGEFLQIGFLLSLTSKNWASELLNKALVSVLNNITPNLLKWPLTGYSHNLQSLIVGNRYNYTYCNAKIGW